jgi:tetratricopeptide (TPR) repeat protein
MRACLALCLLAAGLTCSPCGAAEIPQSTTVIGPSSAMLASGAEALEAGRIEEGIRMTLDGLRGPASERDRAAGHSNLCAGYGLQKRWDEALDHCNKALALDTTNWRTFNNRAAVYTGKGLYDLALTDVQSGLELAPQSRTLRKSLAVVEEHKRAHKERGRSSVQG